MQQLEARAGQSGPDVDVREVPPDGKGSSEEVKGCIRWMLNEYMVMVWLLEALLSKPYIKCRRYSCFVVVRQLQTTTNTKTNIHYNIPQHNTPHYNTTTTGTHMTANMCPESLSIFSFMAASCARLSGVSSSATGVEAVPAGVPEVVLGVGAAAPSAVY